MATTKESSTFTITFVILILAATAFTTTTATAPKTSTTFIKSSCQATLYPTLCFQSLALHASSIKANTHSLVGYLSQGKVNKDLYYHTFKNKGSCASRRAALKDCLDKMGAAEDMIRNSVQEMGRLGIRKASFEWYMSNVQTWVSAALTGEKTFGDGVGKGQVGRRVSPVVDNAKQVTSNALALKSIDAMTFLYFVDVLYDI